MIQEQCVLGLAMFAVLYLNTYGTDSSIERGVMRYGKEIDMG